MSEGEIENFRDLLNKIPDREFDGHTEFEPLTPEQKLNWLAGAVVFYFKYSKSTGRVDIIERNPEGNQ